MSWLSSSTSPGEGPLPAAVGVSPRTFDVRGVFPCSRRQAGSHPWGLAGTPARGTPPSWSRSTAMLRCARSSTHRGVKSSLHLKLLQPVWNWSCSVTFSPQRGGPAHSSAAAPGTARDRLGRCWPCVSLGTAELLRAGSEFEAFDRRINPAKCT